MALSSCSQLLSWEWMELCIGLKHTGSLGKPDAIICSALLSPFTVKFVTKLVTPPSSSLLTLPLMAAQPLFLVHH
jgi:hypothetical protein